MRRRTRGNISDAEARVSRKLVGRSSMTCLRQKVSIWRMSLAARSAAPQMFSSGRHSGEAGGLMASNNVALPCMTVKMLLKSWATPAANWPTASIFCAWRN